METKRGTCDACGHKGGRRQAERSEDLDNLARATGAPVTVPTLDVCAGDLFAEDGPTACLRRMAVRHA